MRPIGSAAELERRRRRAVALVDAGESPLVVARILGVTPTSLHRWRRLARQPDGLTATPTSGPKPRLTNQQWAALEALLRQGAVAHGWPNHLWTAQRVALLIQRHFGIRYHPDHLRRMLRRRLRWTIVWDRNQIHSKSRVVKAWLAKHPEVVVEDFPAHAPDTNADAEVWCGTK